MYCQIKKSYMVRLIIFTKALGNQNIVTIIMVNKASIITIKIYSNDSMRAIYSPYGLHGQKYK